MDRTMPGADGTALGVRRRLLSPRSLSSVRGAARCRAWRRPLAGSDSGPPATPHQPAARDARDTVHESTTASGASSSSIEEPGSATTRGGTCTCNRSWTWTNTPTSARSETHDRRPPIRTASAMSGSTGSAAYRSRRNRRSRPSSTDRAISRQDIPEATRSAREKTVSTNSSAARSRTFVDFIRDSLRCRPRRIRPDQGTVGVSASATDGEEQS